MRSLFSAAVLLLGYAEAMLIAYNNKNKYRLPIKKLYGSQRDEELDDEETDDDTTAIFQEDNDTWPAVRFFPSCDLLSLPYVSPHFSSTISSPSVSRKLRITCPGKLPVI